MTRWNHGHDDSLSSYAVASKLVHDAHRNGGCSIDLAKSRGTIIADYDRIYDRISHFIVGGTVPALKLDASRIDDAMSLDYLVYPVGDWLQETLPDNVDVVGSWIDDGTLYIDACDAIWGFQDALHLANERGELAIYEPATGKCHAVEG